MSTSSSTATLSVDDSGDFRVGLGGDLVGFELVDRLILFDVVAVLYVPGGEDAAADGFAHRGDFNFSCHDMSGIL